MALSTSTQVTTRAAVAAAGTSVAPGTPIPDNCHTVIFLNRSSAQIIVIGQGTAPAAVPDNGSNPVVPIGASLTWKIGVKTERLDDLTDMIFDTVGGAAADCDITYLCQSAAG